MKYTIQIVGVGGQGVLLASNVLGTAAMNAGHRVMMSEVHGMAQRGGSVLSTVRFGDEVYSPLEAEGGADLILGSIVMNLDPVLPSMVAAGFDEYPDVGSLVEAVRSVNPNVVTLDATKLAIEAGKAVAANAVMIGAVAAMKDIPLTRDQLRDALIASVPEKFRDLNLRAFDLGFMAIQN